MLLFFQGEDDFKRNVVFEVWSWSKEDRVNSRCVQSVIVYLTLFTNNTHAHTNIKRWMHPHPKPTSTLLMHRWRQSCSRKWAWNPSTYTAAMLNEKTQNNAGTARMKRFVLNWDIWLIEENQFCIYDVPLEKNHSVQACCVSLSSQREKYIC